MSGGKPLRPIELLKLRIFKIAPEAPYKLWDMARDVVGLLDALGIRKAHIVGASMGGMIAQEIAMQYPERVLSLTSIMSSTGNPKLPRQPAKHPPPARAPADHKGGIHQALRTDLEGPARRIVSARRGKGP